MTYVRSSEIGTFLNAISRTSSLYGLPQPSAILKAGEQLMRQSSYVSTETVGKFWNITASHFPVEFALTVAEEHTETDRVYGLWGMTMDLAPTVEDRLIIGADLLYVHSDGPKWTLSALGDQRAFERKWSYETTTRRADAFATISELREWLIVMQRGVLEMIRPQRLELAPEHLRTLGHEEILHLEGFFGCDVRPGEHSSLLFNSDVLRYPSQGGSHQRFHRMIRALKGRRPPSIEPPQQAIDVARIIRMLRSGERPTEIARAMRIPPQELFAAFRRRVGLNPWRFLMDEVALQEWLAALDERHRRALDLSIRQAARFVGESLPEGSKIIGVDIGGNTLKLTELFLWRLRSRSHAKIQLYVVDPALEELPAEARERQSRILRDLDISVELVPLPWEAFLAEHRSLHSLDFAVSFQLLSMLPTQTLLHLFQSLRQKLVPGGRFFAAFEPYDRVTLPENEQYDLKQRSLDWYREQARMAGLEVRGSILSPAHQDDATAIMANLRLERA